MMTVDFADRMTTAILLKNYPTVREYLIVIFGLPN